jgi:regulator of sigma E protease
MFFGLMKIIKMIASEIIILSEVAEKIVNSFLISLLSFIVAISVIVTIHEFGHYIVARWCGVKVQRFSVGFGQALDRYVSPRSDIEYVVAAIPLGGYVKMLDEREQEVDASEKHRAFNNKSVYSRFAIVAAGPMANFYFCSICLHVDVYDWCARDCG